MRPRIPFAPFPLADRTCKITRAGSVPSKKNLFGPAVSHTSPMTKKLPSVVGQFPAEGILNLSRNRVEAVLVVGIRELIYEAPVIADGVPLTSTCA